MTRDGNATFESCSHTAGDTAPVPIPFISIIIPAYNDQDGLDRCLSAISSQNYPPNRFEVVVVDNGSCPPITIPDSLSQSLSITTLTETVVGSYAARNSGIRAAGGEILAFTDSDCIPSHNWLAAGTRRLSLEPERTILAGKITLFPKSPQSPTPVELFDLTFGLRQSRYVNEYGFAATANLFAPKSAFLDAGLFNKHLKSSGDHEWCCRARDRGYRLLYEGEAEVRHPARHCLAEVLQKRRRITGGRKDLKKFSNSPEVLSHRRGKRIKLALDSLQQIKRVQKQYGASCLFKITYVVIWVMLSQYLEVFFIALGKTSHRS